MVIPPEIRRTEPRIWAKRYLIIDSYSGFVWCWIIKGRKANRLSSIPAYIATQFLAERARRDPVTMADKNKVWEYLRRVIKIGG